MSPTQFNGQAERIWENSVTRVSVSLSVKWVYNRPYINIFWGVSDNESHSVVSNSLWLQILQARILGWLTFPFSRDLPNPGIKPRSSTLQVDSLPAKPQGKSKNTGVDSLSLLQWIFPTQESNQGPLHCRRVLYQPSYQESLFLGGTGDYMRSCV